MRVEATVVLNVELVVVVVGAGVVAGVELACVVLRAGDDDVVLPSGARVTTSAGLTPAVASRESNLNQGEGGKVKVRS